VFLAFRWDQSATDRRPRELARLDWVARRPTAPMDCRRVEGMISNAGAMIILMIRCKESRLSP